MKTRTPWLPEHDLTLKRLAGTMSDARIGAITGHCERTVRARRILAGLPVYRLERAGWTRRDYLLAGAAGLWENAT